MKSITLIATAVIITLTTFNFSSWTGTSTNAVCSTSSEVNDPPTFFYNLNAGTMNTISKERLHNATTVAELFPDFSMQEDVKNNVTALIDVKISVAAAHGHCSKGSSTKRNGNNLSEEQASLLKTTDYSTSFNLEGYVVPNKIYPDLNKQRYFKYNMKVVPENQASYNGGNEAFIDFLTTECQSTIDQVERGNLKGGSISFTVSTSGTLSNINFDSTCGYPSVDQRMVDLIKSLPAGWSVATNSQGEKVEQTLVFSYGQGGC